MANSTFSGPVRSEGGFNVINKATDTGVVTETGFSVNSTGQLVSMGTRKIQSFAGSLASTNAASTAYGDGDVLVELGALNTDAPDGLVTPTKFFIHRALIGITEIVGAGVTSFNEQLSATQSITEIDVNFNDTAGNYHIFVPNVTAAIASKNLYAFSTTAVNADITAGRFTVELEYSVF